MESSLPNADPLLSKLQFEKARKEAYLSATNHPNTRTTSPIVTGTSVLGICYKDGVLLAADTLASYGSLARFKEVERIKQYGNFTCIGGSGEYSDFSELDSWLKETVEMDGEFDDGIEMGPHEFYNYLINIMYQARCRFNPFWNQLVVAGFRDEKSFLGYVDLQGTNYEDKLVATGYGAYIAIPLLREKYREDLSEEEATKVLEDCLRVLFYRDARTINRIQIAKVTAAGVEVGEPRSLETDWLASQVAKGAVGGSW